MTGARMHRRMFLGTALGALATGSGALARAPTNSLRPVIRPQDLGQPKVADAAEIVADARLDAAVVFAVADAASGQALESGQAGVAVPPASVAKALTSLYALDALGGEHRFETRVLATGPVENGRLKGDLILAGGGDPTLDTNALATLAANAKAAGLREVTGSFLVWGGALPFALTIDAEQPDHVGYSPAVSGLNLNYNRVHFEWRKAGSNWQVSMDARSEKYRPDVTMARMRVIDRAVPVYTYADRDGRDDWTVARAALGNGGARWLPVRKPELYAGEVFQTLLRAHGIAVKAPKVTTAAPRGDTLARHLSAPLADLLRDMMKYSTNLTAEVVGLAASRARGATVGGVAASAASMNDWLRSRFGCDIRLVDHSGLGGDSRVTAEDMVKVLAAPGVQARLRPLMKNITLRDEKGRPMRDHPIRVAAKTGTLNFVSGLAGYMTGKDGTDLAFAIFAADVPRREALSEAQRERPDGGRAWNARSKRLQQALIERWGALYATRRPPIPVKNGG